MTQNNLSYELIIERLVNHLSAKGLENLVDEDENIPDSLWLAWQIKQKQSIPTKSQNTDTQGKIDEELPENKSSVDDKGNKSNTKEKQSDKGGLYVDSSGEKKEEDLTDNSEYLPFKTPKAPALQNKLQISRALRPLKRKVPSIKGKILDIEATINQIIEQGIWFPVTKPELERWLDIELIIEQNKSVFIWEQIINELEQIFRSNGIFRRVRTWNLSYIDENNLQLTARNKGNKKNKDNHNYQELIQSNKRTLIILVSNCVSLIWQNPTIYQWLKEWSDKTPVSILQLLPERLWLNTELSYGYPVKFSSFKAGVPNSQLICREKLDVKQSLNLPVVIPTKEYLTQWAKVIAGNGSTITSGIVLDFPFVIEQVSGRENNDLIDINNSQQISPTPDHLVDIFLTTASSQAKQLAGFMAGVPVDLEVVYLIQKNLMPTSSSPVTIAEVFLSGMIGRVNKSDYTTIPQYDFVQGVRKLLNQAMPEQKTEQVLNVVSQYIAKQLDLSIDNFRALLSLQDLSEKKEQKLLPFAKVALEVLTNMGGRYADFAEKVATNFNTAINTPKKPPDSEEPELKEFEVKVATIEIEETKTIPLQRFESETVFVDERGQIIRREPCEAYYFEQELGEAIEPLNMISIPAGEFWMGSPKDEKDSNDSERPQHFVKVAAFYMSQTPITQAQWRAVASLPQEKRELELNPSRFKGDDLPVEKVSWHEAMEFCARLSRHTQANYRLPSEAEWEYACRAILPFSNRRGVGGEGTSPSENLTLAEWNQNYCHPFHFGQTISTELANYYGESTYGDGVKGKNRQKTTSVRSFYPNAFGLYDMHGNVWEWCADPWHNNYNNPPDDGRVWDEQSNNDNHYQNILDNLDVLLNDKRPRVRRGGSWDSDAANCRSAYRYSGNPDWDNDNNGFRVVRV